MIRQRDGVQGYSFQMQPICCKSTGTTYSFSSSLLILAYQALFTLHSSYCICHIAFVTLHLSHCIFHITHLSHCIFHNCICHIAYVTLHLSNCIRHNSMCHICDISFVTQHHLSSVTYCICYKSQCTGGLKRKVQMFVCLFNISGTNEQISRIIFSSENWDPQ